MRHCHSGPFQVFRSRVEGIRKKQRRRARVWAMHRATQRFRSAVCNRQQALSTWRGSEVFVGSRRQCEGERVQNCDGPRPLGDAGALCCSTCEPVDPFCCSVRDIVVMPEDEGLQGHEDDVFLDRLPPLSSSTSYKRTTASTPREHA